MSCQATILRTLDNVVQLNGQHVHQVIYRRIKLQERIFVPEDPQSYNLRVGRPP